MHMPCGLRRLGFGRLMGMLSIVSRTILKSLRLAPSTARPIGTPLASVSKLRFVPSFARSVGFGPVFFPTERRLRHRAVHRHPFPINPFQFVVFPKSLSPELEKYARFGPFNESPMRR